MQIEQRTWTRNRGWSPGLDRCMNKFAQLVLIFGDRSCLKDPDIMEEIKDTYPQALLFGCTTAGEICGGRVFDASIVCTAVEFQHTRIEGAYVDLNRVESSMQAGKILAHSIPWSDLTHVLILSDGIKVNGSELVTGLNLHLPTGVGITGGLAADGKVFRETLVFANQTPREGAVAILGFYGDRIKISYGFRGGWDPFGPERLITRSQGNVLYKMDNHSALDLYKKYLGEYSQGLPAAGLCFPLSIRGEEEESSVVRTIISVNEGEQSLTFAGDIPQGNYARLMKTSNDRLIDGAINAAQICTNSSSPPELAILISCAGRRQILKQRTDEELEGVQEILGKQVKLSGFYSYGEICPIPPRNQSFLHNQTMTITTFREELR